MIEPNTQNLHLKQSLRNPLQVLLCPFHLTFLVLWYLRARILKLYDQTRELKIGDLIEIIPYHVCSTVNLYDELIGVRNGEVEVTWPIWARGKVR